MTFKEIVKDRMNSALRSEVGHLSGIHVVSLMSGVRLKVFV